MSQDIPQNWEEICELRHKPIDTDLARIKSLLDGNGKQGVLADIAVIKDQLAALPVLQKSVAALQIRLASIMGGLVVVDIIGRHLWK